MIGRLTVPLDAVPDALERTGFVLEHEVAEAFKSANWSVIGGRYYADDVDGRARELDLIAYKSFKHNDLTVVYSVLVSCKKDADNTWAFLTRDKPAYDPNFDWNPIHYWTDINPLERYLQSEKWKADFLSRAHGAWSEVAAARDIFAFQQIDSKRAVPKNDVAIFNSITTLMKGLDYELVVLPKRQENKGRIYFFSLLSVVDAPLIEVKYSGNNAEASEVDAITYFARYLVRKRELSALLRFVRRDVLPVEIERLDSLAMSAFQYAKSAVASSFEAIRTNELVRDYFAARLHSRLGWWLAFQLTKYRVDHDSVKISSLNFKNGVLVLELSGIDDDAIAFLNSDDETLQKVGSALEQLAKFNGSFKFDWDIPF
ncbi:hypothetical protein [Luteimonas mephitis]|uniref:hypothetical protein n=1 Tax=Luteimonas mephitis TaxID=83615 RepID=UPI00146B6442|nr:hypothetical protein [Luteimonas mephitis]